MKIAIAMVIIRNEWFVAKTKLATSNNDKCTFVEQERQLIHVGTYTTLENVDMEILSNTFKEACFL